MRRGNPSIYSFMAQGSESDYRLFPSFIASTRSVLNPKNCDVDSCGHAIIVAPHPTDCSSDRSQPANNNRFIEHELNSFKYPVFFEEDF